MSRLYSPKEVIKVLRRKNFVFISQKGSHRKYRKTNKKILTVIVPMHKKQIPRGTLSSIFRQAQISDQDFKKK